MHANSKLLFEKYAKSYFTPGIRVLEVGPDSFPSSYQRIIDDKSITWDTVDIAKNPRLTFGATSEYSFPIPDNTYDIVLSGQVVEHVRKVWVWIKEVARVCKKGGTVITVNPVSWPFHEAPLDCWRIYPDGMKSLYEEAGLNVSVSLFESMEAVGFKRYIPGVSPEEQSWKRRFGSYLLGKAGFPVERAYDTITIGRKDS